MYCASNSLQSLKNMIKASENPTKTSSNFGPRFVFAVLNDGLNSLALRVQREVAQLTHEQLVFSKSSISLDFYPVQKFGLTSFAYKLISIFRFCTCEIARFARFKGSFNLIL